MGSTLLRIENRKGVGNFRLRRGTRTVAEDRSPFCVDGERTIYTQYVIHKTNVQMSANKIRSREQRADRSRLFRAVVLR